MAGSFWAWLLCLVLWIGQHWTTRRAVSFVALDWAAWEGIDALGKADSVILSVKDSNKRSEKRTA